MTQNKSNIRPLSTDEHNAVIGRMRSYDALPEEECVEKLRAEIRSFENSILAITGDTLETCWWDTVKPENVSGYVDDLIGLRYYALTRLFEIHCTEAEVRRIERVNAKLLEMTDEMFGYTGQVYRHFLDMPRDRSGEDIEVEGTLRFWEDAEALRLEDDDPGRRFNSSMSDRELGMVNNLDDGVSWAGAGFHDARLSHIVFCYASHAIIAHKDFTIPDYMRMDEYEVKVDIRYQHFKKTV